MNEPRRSFLGDLGLPPAPQEHVQSIPSASAPIPEGPKRRGRKPAHKRKRDWEKTHKPHTFVGIPLEIREAVRDLADHFRREHGMVGGVDAVARELLRYSLAQYAAGSLDIRAERGTGKSALISAPGRGISNRTIPMRKPVQKKAKAPTATYRLPDDQVAAMRAILQYEEHKAAPAVIHLTLGQVCTRLLAHALDAYRAELWSLYTTPIMTVQGLAGGNQ